MNDQARHAIDDATLDRFFERQRAEIVARIEAAETPARRPAPLLALAASAVLAALLGAGVLGTGPADEDRLAGLTLWTMESYIVSDDPDPLRHYGEWDDAAAPGDGPLAAFRVPVEEFTGGETDDTLMDIPFEWTIDTPETDPASRG